MEESKVKTAEENFTSFLIDHAVIDVSQENMFRPLLSGFVEAFKDHITKLEVRNKELEALVKELIPIAKDGYRLHIKNACHQDFLEEDEELLSKAEQALNKKL